MNVKHRNHSTVTSSKIIRDKVIIRWRNPVRIRNGRVRSARADTMLRQSQGSCRRSIRERLSISQTVVVYKFTSNDQAIQTRFTWWSQTQCEVSKTSDASAMELHLNFPKKHQKVLRETLFKNISHPIVLTCWTALSVAWLSASVVLQARQTSKSSSSSNSDDNSSRCRLQRRHSLSAANFGWISTMGTDMRPTSFCYNDHKRTI